MFASPRLASATEHLKPLPTCRVGVLLLAYETKTNSETKKTTVSLKEKQGRGPFRQNKERLPAVNMPPEVDSVLRRGGEHKASASVRTLPNSIGVLKPFWSGRVLPCMASKNTSSAFISLREGASGR